MLSVDELLRSLTEKLSLRDEELLNVELGWLRKEIKIIIHECSAYGRGGSKSKEHRNQGMSALRPRRE